MTMNAQAPLPDAEETAPVQTTALVALPPVPARSKTRKALALGALALGSFALGAVAIGAAAIGLLVIGRLKIGAADAGRVRIGRLEIDEFLVRKVLAPGAGVDR